MWQHFTESARRLVLLAQEEAMKLRSEHVGTEHLLLGLVILNEGTAVQILERQDITLLKVRLELGLVNRSENSNLTSEIKLSSGAKRTLELAADEARRLHHSYIGTEHILLGLLRQSDEIGAKALNRLGLELKTARTRVEEHLGTPATLPQPATKPENHAALPELRPFVAKFLEIYFTPQAREVLLSAYAESEKAQTNRIGVEHLIIAVMSEQNAAILRDKLPKGNFTDEE